jgi:hypothetical protein
MMWGGEEIERSWIISDESATSAVPIEIYLNPPQYTRTT